MTSVYLRWLGVIAIALPAGAAFLWVVAIARESQELGAGALDFAIAGWLLQWGVLALLLWLLGRGVAAHLPPIVVTAETHGLADGSAAPAEA